MPNLNPFKRAIAVVDFDNAALIRQWLHGRPATTIAAYASDLERLLRFLDNKPLNLIELRDLQAFADSLHYLAPGSQARILKACKSLLTFGCKTMPALFPLNAGAALKLPKSKNVLAERILAERDVLMMIELEPVIRNKLILRLLYISGVRRSELCGIRFTDLQERPELNAGQVTIFGKGGKTRVIVLTHECWNWLRGWRILRGNVPNDALVFDLCASTIYKIVRAAAKRAGLEKPVSPHWMRHAHASHALDRGAPISLVQATLGHENIQTTGKYLHARPGESSGKYLP